MKKSVVCVLICLVLILTGCRYHGISAESCSAWESADSLMHIVICDSYYGTGSLTIADKTTEIECHFGPGKTEFAVYVLPECSVNPTDGDAWLFIGDYRYNEKDRTITLEITQDQIGLNVDEIVLYEVEA